MLPSYDAILADEDVIEVGNLRLHTIHTPGHTPGSQCFRVEDGLIAGDTLFLQGCGRVDLPASSGPPGAGAPTHRGATHLSK